MIISGNNLTGFVITVIALTHGSFACIISAIIFSIIIYHQYYVRMKRENRIALILCANIYLLICLYTITLVSLNIRTLLGDLYGQNFDSPWCTFTGYFVSAVLSALYNGFLIQAFFRLCRIVYSSHRCFQLFWFYSIVPPIQSAVAFALLSPLLFWHDVNYLPNEHYCFTSFSNVRAMVWTASTNYGTPLFCLSIIYLRITRFIRQQPRIQTIAVKRRQERDLLVFQRIIILVSILLGLGIPSIILATMSFIAGVEHPLIYRITWLSTDVSMAILSVLLVLTTPQLKSILLERWQRNRVMPIGATQANSIQMRTVQCINLPSQK